MELSRLFGWKISKTELANYLKTLINGQHWLKATTIHFKGVFQHTWSNVHATSSSIIINWTWEYTKYEQWIQCGTDLDQL
jgi:hypothetical protein